MTTKKNAQKLVFGFTRPEYLRFLAEFVVNERKRPHVTSLEAAEFLNRALVHYSQMNQGIQEDLSDSDRSHLEIITKAFEKETARNSEVPQHPPLPDFESDELPMLPPVLSDPQPPAYEEPEQPVPQPTSEVLPPIPELNIPTASITPTPEVKGELTEFDRTYPASITEIAEVEPELSERDIAIKVVQIINKTIARGGRSQGTRSDRDLRETRYTTKAREFARNYFICLLQGQYVETSEYAEEVREVMSDIELRTERSLNAYLDFTDNGHHFLTRNEEPEEETQTIARLLINSLQNTRVSNSYYTARVFTVLLPDSPIFDPEGEFKKVDRSHKGRCTPESIQYAESLKPKAIQYAKDLFGL